MSVVDFPKYYHNEETNGGYELFDLVGGIVPMKYNQRFDARPKESYTKDINRALSIISYMKENNRVYGSFNHISQAYPGDIDTTEIVKTELPDNKAPDFFVKTFQQVIEKVVKAPNTYLGDIKFCTDIDLYKAYIKIDMSEKIIDIKKKIRHMNEQGLISDDDFKELMSIYINKYDKFTEEDLIDKNYKSAEYKAYYKFSEKLRNLIILRWSKNEIKQGYKILQGNRKITMEHAILNCGSPCGTHMITKRCQREFPLFDLDELTSVGFTKVDMWTLVNGKFIEVTNLIGFVDKDNTSYSYGRIAKNKKDAEDMIEGLKDQTAMMYYHPIEMV